MQELRFVLIVVGALAIAALLFHGLWTSKKEGKSKFGDKPLGKLDVGSDEIADRSAERGFAPEDDFDIIRKERKEPDLSVEPLEIDPLASDPLVDNYVEPDVKHADINHREVDEQAYSIDHDLPSMSAVAETVVAVEPLNEKTPIETSLNETSLEPVATAQSADESITATKAAATPQVELTVSDSIQRDEPLIEESENKVEDEQPEMDVIVLNVHCSGEQAFVGTKLFDSMQQNGLLYGEMDIFHRHADLSGTGKVLFSVANMMQPGTLQHDDPALFTTKGISFFMTLPCFGDAEQNFKLMLRTAQQIADDLGANVLDDARNLMTPNRLDAYRAQIKKFKAAHAS
ncbi:cell division protein ZipA [Vibrio ichthyoenteri ATCC 700023]|uniref:Cell division protein ZipA n=1 Tax=Vibrio ichthyoenteri ATCC 700023 TaxID=870968 RepID=F9RZM6_9VIBR|nr:cell division protein ZipA [Vibrio ichthyoenteri]EGU44846.1 cell division protein ZipA [Vibrio ichthyoenteri ATCC 700023]